jgi:molecular chaperone GrpE
MNIDVKTIHPTKHSPREAAEDFDTEVTTPVPTDQTLEPAALSEMRDRWMRSEAEAANIRTRCKRDIDEARQFAVQKFAADVVEMAENLKRGVDSLPARLDREPEIVTRLRDGFSGVEHSFVNLLERNGIVRHDPTGMAFDPGLHEAMEQRVSGDHTPGTVLQAWTSAWTLNGRLLRPAMVVVSKSSPAATQSSTGENS